MLGAELLARGVRTKIDKRTSDLSILGDPVQLQQVILNLIMNAADAMASMEAGHRVVTLSTRTTETGDAEVEVRDRGPGIPVTVGDPVFRPFYTTKENGLGLGLPICSTILLAHGGALSLANGEEAAPSPHSDCRTGRLFQDGSSNGGARSHR